METRHRQLIERLNLGTWGVKRLQHLAEHDPSTLAEMEASGDLEAHLAETDADAGTAFSEAMSALHRATQGAPYPEKEGALRSGMMQASSEILRERVLTTPARRSPSSGPQPEAR
jgi:hypothetical protein